MLIAQWIIGPQLVGGMLLLTGFIQKTWPPKSINGYYGYRTPTSTKNQQTWDEGNSYSAMLMVRMGFIALVLGLAIAALVPFDKKHALIPILSLMVTGIGMPIILMVKAENHLNKKFDKPE